MSFDLKHLLSVHESACFYLHCYLQDACVWWCLIASICHVRSLSVHTHCASIHYIIDVYAYTYYIYTHVLHIRIQTLYTLVRSNTSCSVRVIFSLHVFCINLLRARALWEYAVCTWESASSLQGCRPENSSLEGDLFCASVTMSESTCHEFPHPLARASDHLGQSESACALLLWMPQLCFAVQVKWWALVSWREQKERLTAPPGEPNVFGN